MMGEYSFIILHPCTIKFHNVNKDMTIKMKDYIFSVRILEIHHWL